MTGRLNWLRVIKFIKTESRLVVSRAWGKNRVESVIRVSVLQNVKSSGCGWWWWSYNSINILSTVELFVVVQLLSHVWLFVTPWTAAQSLVLHYLSEFAPTLICWVCDAIQPSYPLWPSSPPALNFSQHQGLFQWNGSLHQMSQLVWLNIKKQNKQSNQRMGRRPTQTFLQRTHTDGQKAHEKMLNIANY